MAGNYMDAPNDRVAWDRDGSLLATITAGGSVVQQNAAVRRALNAETENAVPELSGYRKIAVVFPLPMDCTAVFVAYGPSSPGPTFTVETSKDTTNGIDGTWDAQNLVALLRAMPVKPNYRVLSQMMMLLPNSTSSDLRGIRVTSSGDFTASNGLKVFHIYGRPSPGATTDRLALWHPTTDVRLPSTWFDWGNVPRSSSEDRSFRIKNLSTHLDATDVDVYSEALTPGTPSVATMHTFSVDAGATFEAATNLSLLLPGEISGVIIVRRVVPANAQVSVFSGRVAVDVNLWMEHV